MPAPPRLRSRAAALAALVAIVVSTLTSSVQAADGAGKFAAKGFGNSSCSSVTGLWSEDAGNEAVQTRTAFIGWIEGYITAANQFMPNTFDIASWRSAPYLAASIGAYCTNKPEVAIMQAAQAMVRQLSRDKLPEAMPMVAFSNGQTSVKLYQSVYADMRRALTQRAHLAFDTEFDNAPAVSRALAQFQAAKGFPVTGLPDENTLYHLYNSAE